MESAYGATTPTGQFSLAASGEDVANGKQGNPRALGSFAGNSLAVGDYSAQTVLFSQALASSHVISVESLTIQ